jgi:PEP-CTERM motif-containing protein
MNRFKAVSSLLCLLAVAFVGVATVNGGTVEFVDDMDNGIMDVFLTPSQGSEFTNFDLIATPEVGSILDPVRNESGNAGDYDASKSRVDTWANTAFSSVGAGTPSFIFTKYTPGSPPFTPSDPMPAAGGDPDQLNWSIFDTNTGDGPDFGPYHVARILYEGQGTIDILAFDTLTAATGGELFSSPYGVPEPSSILLFGLAACGVFGLRRRG